VSTHGTVYTYRKGCRCEKCRQANYRTNQRWREKVAGAATPPGVHGTVNGYKFYGCRCDACRKANSDQIAKAAARRARMRALAAAGLPRDWEGEIPAVS
jgi:hypothetical protein